MARRINRQKESRRKIFLSLLMIICLYFIFALFGSPLVGNAGEELGFYLRTAWGGALTVPLLFWLYLCAAGLMRLKVPYIPRQILGTLQLYISFAFMLGLLKETGWNSELTLFLPGNFGRGLAHIFYLNLGGFLTLLLVAGSFILSALLFGSKILNAQFPEISLRALKKNKNSDSAENRPRRRRRRINNNDAERERPIGRPEDILFMKNLPEPQLRSDEEKSQALNVKDKKDDMPDFPRPKLKADPMPEPSEIEDDFASDQQEQEQTKNNYAVEIIDNLLASINSNSGTAVLNDSKHLKTSEREQEQETTPNFRRPLFLEDLTVGKRIDKKGRPS